MGKRCIRMGCRAWAMRGDEFCVAHRREHPPEAATPETEAVGATALELVEQIPAFTQRVLAGDRERLVDRRILALIAEVGANRAIETEIGALRLLLLRTLAEGVLEGDLSTTALTVARLTDAIGRLLKVGQVLAGGRASALEESLTQVLIELGLGGDEEPPDYDEPGGFAESWSEET